MEFISISLTLLFSTSFRIKRKLGRLIVFIILLIINIITCFIFSIIPKNNVTFQRISNRLSFFLSSITGSWLFCSVGVDLFIGIGLLDSFTLLVSDNGIFKDGSSSTLASIEDGDDRIGFENVVKWNQGKCKGLLAGIWLLLVCIPHQPRWVTSV